MERIDKRKLEFKESKDMLDYFLDELDSKEG